MVPPPRSPSSSLSAARRADELEALAGGEVVDLLVVGGGVTGAGVALDAASRGLSVALVERRDLAHGTSRWSSKLVHGGLRYLARGDVGLAFESARERGILMETTAPHLVHPLPMVLALQDHVSRAREAATAAGFRVGDLLRRMARTTRTTLPGPRRLTPEQTLRGIPGLRTRDLRGGLLSFDGQLTDDVRLVVALARTAALHGARVVTHCEVERLDGDGAACLDVLGGARLEIRARAVVNATGVWADRLVPEVALRPSKGAHLVVAASALGHPSAALTVPVPGTVNRFVFALPQPGGLVYVGLTDDPASDVITDEPVVSAAERRFLLDVVNAALARPLTDADVVGAFAGYRPLLQGDRGGTADLSRRHAVLTSREGVVSVVGGKLTTYRRMAEDAVDRSLAASSTGRGSGLAGRPVGPCRTRRLPLVGAAPRAALAALGAPRRLVWRYGTEAPAVAALAERDPDLAQRVVAGADVTRAEFAFAVAHEGALTVDDLLDRRVRLGLVPELRAAARPAAEAALARG